MQKDKQILKRFMMIGRQMQKFNRDIILQECNIKQNEFAVLHMLERYQQKGVQEMKISDVAKHLKNATSTISPIIQSLVEKEFISRTTSKEDRRVAMIVLTDKGNEQLKQIMQRISRQFNEVLARLGTEKTEQLLDLLDELSKILTDMGE